MEEKSIDFEQYEVYLYSRNGTFICNTKNKNVWINDYIEKDLYNESIYDENNIKNSNNEIKRSSNNKKKEFNSDAIISKLIKGICISDFKKYKKNEGIHYNTLLINRIKISIVNIPVTNLVALGIFSKDTKSSIIRIFLLNMIISFINYLGKKNDFFKSKGINDSKFISKMNEANFSNYLYSKIYDTFLSIPIQINFSRIVKKIFKRRALYIKDIYYKNYYLIDLSNDKIVLSLEALHDKNNDKDPVLKTSSQNNFWNELIFHSHNLKNDYIKKNNMTFNGIDYQNFFVKIEYKATYPRRNFIIKFLPLLNGMCIIHEYIQLKISTFEEEEKKSYNEKNIIYGYDAYDNIFRNSDNRYFENEHYLLKQVHFFIIESLFCSNTSFSYFFVFIRQPKIYFSDEILEIIDNEIIQYLKNNNNNGDFNYNCTNDIINRLINVLYEEFMQINSTEKLVHKSSNQILDKGKKNNLILKEIQSLDSKNKSLRITKNETLIFLFNSIQFNKNINPNDITIDLNDERISLLRITQNENEDFSSLRGSELIEKKKRPSLRLSELLEEKKSIRPSRKTNKSQVTRDSKFPYDSEEKDDKKDVEIPLKEEENEEGNIYNVNLKRFSYTPKDNTINNNSINNGKINDNNIENYGILDTNSNYNEKNIEKNNVENNGIINSVENDILYNNFDINKEPKNNDEIINYNSNYGDYNNNEFLNNKNIQKYDENNEIQNENNIDYDINENQNENNIDEVKYYNNNEMQNEINSNYNNYEENKNDEFNDNDDEYINNYYIKNVSSKKNLKNKNFFGDYDVHEFGDNEISK